MASSNRHWPSMFKSKSCNTTHHHHCWDINSSSLLSSPQPCHRPSPYSSSGTCEERSPEPKPRWNPKPEQIRILESIFNSGMVNPPRDEIRKIRAQLQEYGQVGDANVFYWFQNRKSRSKHKNRHLQTTTKTTTAAQSPPVVSAALPTSSSSSSSEKSSSDQTNKSASATFTLLNSPTASVNQQRPYFSDLLQEPYYFSPASTGGGGGGGGGFCFPELGSTVMDHHGSDQTDGGLLTDLMMMTKNSNNNKGGCGGDDRKMMKQRSYGDNISGGGGGGGGGGSSGGVSVTTAAPICHSFVAPTAELLSNISHIQGVDAPGGYAIAKSTVFINDVAFEVPVGPFSVREAFGEDAVLIDSSGHPVVTNDWGVTLQSLQHGAFYYLLRTLSQVNSLDLIWYTHYSN